MATLLLHDTPKIEAHELVSKLISYGRSDSYAEEIHSKFRWRLSQFHQLCDEHARKLEARAADYAEMESLRYRVRQLTSMLKQFDADGDYKLTIHELARAFRALGLPKREGVKSTWTSRCSARST